MWKEVKKILLSILLTLGLGGGLGGFLTFGGVRDWYPLINKPSWTPPSWLFSPVWTTLFIFMGLAYYLVGNSRKSKKIVDSAKRVFYFQLTANVLWSALFFTMRQPWWAYLDIVVLWILIVITITRFLKIDRLAGALLIPYLLWVTFASFLNLAVAWLN